MEMVSSPRQALRGAFAPGMLGAAVAFLGGVFLVALYLSSLRSLTPGDGFVAMQYNTALGFVVTGVAVVAQCLGRRRIALWGGAAAAGLGSMALAEHMLGRSLHLLDALLGGSFRGPAEHLMSPNTALCFALAGCVIVTMRAPGTTARWRRLATGMVAAVLVAAGCVGLLAFISNDGSIYGWAHLTRMEAHTALGFVGLGTAFFVMIVRLKDEPTGIALPNWAPWTVGVGVAALSLALWANLTASDARLRSIAATRTHEAALAHTSQLLQAHLRSLKQLAVESRDSDGEGSNFRRSARVATLELPGLRTVGWVDEDGRVTFATGATGASVLEEALARRPELHSALNAARLDGSPSASDPRGLSGEIGDLFVFVPVERYGELRGTLVCEHELQPLFDWVFGAGMGRAFDVELSTQKGGVFYRSQGCVPAGARAGDADLALAMVSPPASAPRPETPPTTMTRGRVSFADQIFILAGEADGAWLAGGRNAGSTLILWFGLFLAVALAIVIRKSELVRQRAASLDAAKRTIEEHAAWLQRTQTELTSAAREKRRVLDSLSALLIGVDQNGRVVEWNSVAASVFGMSDEQALGRHFHELPLAWDRELIGAAVRECRVTGERVRCDSISVAGNASGAPSNGASSNGAGSNGAGSNGASANGAGPAAQGPGAASSNGSGSGGAGVGSGSNRVISITLSPTQTESGRGFALVGTDVTERQMLEMQLHQAQRLESVGTLAAGIAHEINTPMQFVSDNIRFVSQTVVPLTGLLKLMPEMLAAAKAGRVSKALAKRLHAAADGVDADFLVQELPAALDETQEGVGRVTTIVRAMKDFSHPGNQGRKSADLNKAIATTLAVARNEYKYVADVETDFGDVPEIECWIADLNQVFLNLLVNAAHAIKDVVGNTGKKGIIRVSTRVDGDCVEIRFADSGTGIPEAIRPKIWDQFFTTKEIGRGTGLGLAIVRAVVVDRHRGSVDFESELGRGTTFIVRLPLEAQPEDPPAAPVHGLQPVAGVGA